MSAEENKSRIQAVTEGITSFVDKIRAGEWADVAMRIGIFCLLVFLTHLFIIFIIYRIIIPIIQMWFYDAIFDEVTKRFDNAQWGGFKVSDFSSLT